MVIQLRSIGTSTATNATQTLGTGVKNVKYSSTLSVHFSQVPGRFFGNQWGQQQLHKKEDV
jgi:hypothetical protein